MTFLFDDQQHKHILTVLYIYFIVTTLQLFIMYAMSHAVYCVLSKFGAFKFFYKMCQFQRFFLLWFCQNRYFNKVGRCVLDEMSVKIKLKALK